MISALLRKARQVTSDTVLRRYLVDKALGRIAKVAPWQDHRPAYLEGLVLEDFDLKPDQWPVLDKGQPQGAITLALPGQDITLQPHQVEDFFSQSFRDIEAELGAHRFAWLPLQVTTVDPQWVARLWQVWGEGFAEPDDSWAWHPYTATERALNLLDFSARYGLPGKPEQTLKVLAAHAGNILKKLEYFGDHHTGNHCANNGRGLYRLGLALGNDSCAAIGIEILRHEARRILGKSGILRENSSHYHLLLTRNYADCWLAARRHNRPEALDLQKIVEQMIAAVPALFLSGGLPLIGDVSPDCPPSFLLSLAGRSNAPAGWLETLSIEDQAALADLRAKVPERSLAEMAQDGWHRGDFSGWSGLWHCDPKGWSHMPGHGHQDVGAFEIHFDGEPLFIDLGRGAYGEMGEAALYRSAWAHNTLLVNGCDPYPANKPYYDDPFRQRICGQAPEVARSENGLMLSHWGFKRLGNVASTTRQWEFFESEMKIEDRVEGRAKVTLERRFATTLAVDLCKGGVVIKGQNRNYHLRAEGDITLEPAVRWTAYGRGEAATIIKIENRTRLPFQTTLTVEVQ